MTPVATQRPRYTSDIGKFVNPFSLHVTMPWKPQKRTQNEFGVRHAEDFHQPANSPEQAHIDDEDLFLAYDADLDYTLNFQETYFEELISPLFTYEPNNETGFLLGFGYDAVPAFTTLMSDPNGIAESLEELNITHLVLGNSL